MSTNDIYSKYFIELLKQFCNAKGLEYNTKYLNDEFILWVAENQMLCREYKKYLDYLISAFDEKEVVEIGKGRYDSISEVNSNIKPISAYGETINGFKPYIVLVNPKIILTHNPYNYKLIMDWYKIHNQGIFDISIGVYGNLADKDINEKLKLMKTIYDNMDDDCTFDYDTDNGSYFCSLNSKRKIKIKILER